MATDYATPSDVQRILGLEYPFTNNTNPTLADVEATINEAEDEVDDFTRRAWREKTITNEVHDFPQVPYNYYTGIPIYLRRESVRDFDTAQGDKIEVWNGTDWIDWVATKTSGRGNDYWLEGEKGILYLRTTATFYRERALRVTYRYGETTVPKTIRGATAKIAASILLLNDDRSGVVDDTGTGQNVSYESRVRMIRGQAFRALDRYASPMLIR